MRKKITLSLFLVLFLIASKISAQSTTGIKYPAGIRQATSSGLKISPNPLVFAQTTNSSVITGCTSATNGLFPSNTITPNCSGNYETITSQSYAGEYSNVNVIANKQYSFSSSVTNDYITITNGTGTIIYASGTQPVIWDSGSTTGVIRYYLHTNATCSSEQVNRSRYLRCADASNCVPPSNLVVSNVTSNSCKIAWTAASPVPSSNYDIYIVTTNNAPDANSTPTLFSTTNLSTSISLNVAAGTTYYYWIRSNCGATTGSWISGGNFTTPPALTCNGASYGLYPDATFTPTCTGNPQQIVADAYAGEYSNVNVVANTQYTFFSSVSSDYITVTNALGNTVLASGTTPLNWVSGTYSGTVRYHINTNASCGTQNTNRVRYIQCMGLTTCGVPSNLVVSNITSNSCRLTWSPPATTPTGYDVYLSTVNTAPVSGTAATYTATGTFIASVNPLTASTTYFYWVRSNCNGTKSNWVSGGSFTTLTPLTCNGAIYGLFPAATFTPSCTGNPEQIVNNAYAGEFANVNILINKQYTFTSSVTTDFITITNEGGTAVLASGLTPLTWNSNFTGVIRYHINSNANCGTQATSRVRSITCATPTGCNTPLEPYTDGVTSTSINIGWFAATPVPNNGYIYCYSTINDPFSDGAITGTTTDTFAVLNNLSPNTTYYFWVKSNCGQTQTDWISGGSFTTYSASGCNAPTQLYYDGLTSTTNNIAWVAPTPAPSNGYVYCYSTINDPFSTGAITGTTTETYAVLNNLSPNTTYYFWVKSNCGQTQTDWVAGPSFTTTSATGCNFPTQLFSDPESATVVNIAWVEPNPAPSNGYIYSYSTVNDPFSANAITGTTTNTFAVLNNLSPNTTYYFWVKSNCGQTQTDWVAGPSFTTTSATGCNFPTQLFSDPESATVVNIAWVAPNPAPSNGYIYSYSTVNDPFSANAITGTTTNTFAVLNNLSPNTTYYFWVKSNCGQTQTDWLAGPSFTTTSATGCNGPTQLFYDGLTSTTNNIAWVAPTPAPSNGYVYCYSTINDPFSAGTITGTTTDTFAVLSNLLPNTTYYFWVKSNCGQTQTNWVSGGSFTTQVLSSETFSLDKIKLYPNPVKSIFNISLDKEITTVSIYNLLGQEVLSKSVNSNETSIDVNDLTAGTYLVKVTSNNEVKTLKIIKQ